MFIRQSLKQSEPYPLEREEEAGRGTGGGAEPGAESNLDGLRALARRMVAIPLSDPLRDAAARDECLGALQALRCALRRSPNDRDQQLYRLLRDHCIQSGLGYDMRYFPSRVELLPSAPLGPKEAVARRCSKSCTVALELYLLLLPEGQENTVKLCHYRPKAYWPLSPCGMDVIAEYVSHQSRKQLDEALATLPCVKVLELWLTAQQQPLGELQQACAARLEQFLQTIVDGGRGKQAALLARAWDKAAHRHPSVKQFMEEKLLPLLLRADGVALCRLVAATADDQAPLIEALCRKGLGALLQQAAAVLSGADGEAPCNEIETLLAGVERYPASAPVVSKAVQNELWVVLPSSVYVYKGDVYATKGLMLLLAKAGHPWRKLILQAIQGFYVTGCCWDDVVGLVHAWHRGVVCPSHNLWICLDDASTATTAAAIAFIAAHGSQALAGGSAMVGLQLTVEIGPQGTAAPLCWPAGQAGWAGMFHVAVLVVHGDMHATIPFLRRFDTIRWEGGRRLLLIGEAEGDADGQPHERLARRLDGYTLSQRPGGWHVYIANR